MKKYLQFIKENKELETGIISIDGIIYHLQFNNTREGLDVDLMINDNIYQNLSVHTPDSDKLDADEFFLNPIVDKKIVDTLEKENFISKGNSETIAGDKKTISYHLNFSVTEKKENNNFEYKTFNYVGIIKDDNNNPKIYITKYSIIKDDGQWMKIKGTGYEYKKVDTNKKGWVPFNDEIKINKKDIKEGTERRKIYLINQ